MKFSALSATFALVAIVNAHSTIWNIYVNGVNQGVGNSAAGYIRTPPNNNPVKDITSNNLTCNVNNAATAKTVTAAAGDNITVEWHHNDNSASDDIIASSHKGPILVYIAPTASDGTGNVWVKLAESGYNSGTWAVDTLIANKGKHSFTLPSVLASGNYLVRPEIIALHEADAAYNVNPARGAQFYMECIQLQVTGNGGTSLPAGVAIPGAYKYTDPGVVFNLYGTFTSYTIPGPPVWNAASSGVSGSNATSPAPSNSTASASTAGAAPSAAPALSTSTYYACSTTMSTVVGSAPTASSIAGTGAVAKWSQCGGKDYTGGTSCVSGTTCQVINDYYSQCL